MAKQAEPGTVSHGTMRSVDLVGTFMDFMKEHDNDKWRSMFVGLMAEIGVGRYNAWLRGECEEDAMDWFLQETLWDAMSELAPEGHYFGAHPGDGSDYGYWPDEDADDEEEELA